MEFRSPSPPSHARFIWVEDGATPRRNQYVRFVREFELDSQPAALPFHLFADTRYRLRVNGAFMGTGPGRFVTQHPEFDSVDLAHRMLPGGNRIDVEVNFFGANSFQTMPDGEPGFIAWGGADGVDLATGDGWKAERLDAWRHDTPLATFAQNPIEICDTRRLDTGVPVAIRELSSGPWGVLTPFSGTPLPFFPHLPTRLEVAGKLKAGRRRLGFMAHEPRANKVAGVENTSSPRTAAFLTWIHSPGAQTVRVDCYWGDYFCNGTALRVEDCGRPGHLSADMPLNAGWNLFACRCAIPREHWALCAGFPADVGLGFHARRDASCREPIAVHVFPPGTSAELPTADNEELPSGWEPHSGDPNNLTPARMMAWDALDEIVARNTDPAAAPHTIHAPSATWCWSYLGAFLGHIEADVEAPAGAVLDIAVNDWQNAEGTAGLYAQHPYLETADRFLLQGGRQTVQIFHPRGGKLLQATLRSPDGLTAPLSLHAIRTLSRQALGSDHTWFSCDDATMEWVWPTALRTLIVSTDDAYSDSPWRERSSYVGDALVNLHLHTHLTPDLRTAARVLRGFGQAQLANGQIPACAPSWLRRSHQDFSLHWLQLVHDYWAFTGDLEPVDELWPTILRLWESPAWTRGTSGLWDVADPHLFIDWGVLKEERCGIGNGVLNILRAGAARRCATLAGALGRNADASRFATEESDAIEGLFAALWEEDSGRFRAFKDATTPAIHANVMALYNGIGSREQRLRILGYLEPFLRCNPADARQHGVKKGYLELFYMFFALPALAEHGRPDLAEFLVREQYGIVKDRGEDTLPEYTNGYDDRSGSRCHSWSGGAAVYAARHVLGIRQRTAGDTTRLTFCPVVSDIHRASGRIAHPEGWIDVSWRRAEDGPFIFKVNAPPGVVVEDGTPGLHPS